MAEAGRKGRPLAVVRKRSRGWELQAAERALERALHSLQGLVTTQQVLRFELGSWNRRKDGDIGALCQDSCHTSISERLLLAKPAVWNQTWLNPGFSKYGGAWEIFLAQNTLPGSVIPKQQITGHGCDMTPLGIFLLSICVFLLCLP